MTNANLQLSLTANPFAVLGVSTRDDRSAVIAAAEDRALLGDDDNLRDAKAILTNPRRRLEAEVAWMPGVSPNRAKAALEIALAPTTAELDGVGIDGLAKANLIATILPARRVKDAVEIRLNLENLSNAINEVDPDKVLQAINEDRALAGFPAVPDTGPIDDEIEKRRRAWLASAESFLAQQPTVAMVEALHTLSSEPSSVDVRFLDDLVDAYALRAGGFLEKESATASQLIGRAMELAPDRSDAIGPLIDGIEEILETWKDIAFPIQASAARRGQREIQSDALGRKIRDLSIFLHNEHALTGYSRRLTNLVAENFAGLPEVAAQMEEDSAALDSYEESTARGEAAQAEWATSISYAADIGTFAKSRIALSKHGFDWKGERIPLDEVTSCRWGGLSKSVNGIPTGTEYRIVVGGAGRQLQADFTKRAIFEALVPKLWMAVGPQIIVDILNQLRSGATLDFGSIQVRDDGVVLKRTGMFGGPRELAFGWADVSITNAPGSVVIFGREKKKYRGTAEYRTVDNAHFLEHIVRQNFENGILRMSSMLD